jgi:hypothetical protein
MENLNGNWEGMGLILRDLGHSQGLFFLRQRPSKTALETLVIPEKAGTYICYNK